MNDTIKEKLKMKIAISQMKNEEEKAMNKKGKLVFKNIAIAAGLIISLTGVTFAGSKVIENIWKTPEKIEENTEKLTKESKIENITEEAAKEIAINKLQEVNFNSNIVSTDHYKEVDSNKIIYRFVTEDNYAISIDGQRGVFFEISNYNNNQDINTEITQEEAIEIANNYIKLFGIDLEGYEIKSIYSNNKEGSGEGSGYKIDINYCKKYGDFYNPYEYVSIGVESKNKDFDHIRVGSIPFDNNETIITKDEAIQIALKEDEKIDTNKIVETKAEKMVVKMNADAYERINNKEEYYAAMQTPDYPTEKRNYYNMEERVRNAWVVVLTYEDNYNGDIVKRYTEGKYSYFVDCTTGEIIGGDAMDYTVSN